MGRLPTHQGEEGDSSSRSRHSRSRRHRSRRKSHSNDQQSIFHKKGRGVTDIRNHQRDDFLLSDFPSLKEISRKGMKVVGNEYFADLKATPEQPLKEDQNTTILSCCYCRQPIKEMSLAIDVPDKDSPAHFDCVIEHLKKDEDLKPEENLIYMGNRKFAVVVYKNNSHSFDILREIPFEESKDFKPWRNEFSVRMRSRLE